jgi:hypothetical protein
LDATQDDASVISLKAIDIVSHDDPSFTDQFIEVLPDLEALKMFDQRNGLVVKAEDLNREVVGFGPHIHHLFGSNSDHEKRVVESCNLALLHEL